MKKNIFKIVGISIFILAFISLFYSKYEENLLRKEFSNLVSKDLYSDKYDTKTKTTFRYRKLEKGMKRYFKDYSDNLKNLKSLFSDKDLKHILSADNYAKDGKEFVNSKIYLTAYREKFDKSMDTLSYLDTEKGVMSYIDTKKLNSHFVKLYKSMMLDDNMKKELNKNKEYLKNANNNINNLLGVYESTLNFLSSTNTWTVRNGQIVFTSTNDLNRYNELISSIK